MSEFERISSAYNRVPEEEVRSRISRLQALMRHDGIDIVFLNQLIDRFYFSGTAQDGVLLIPSEGDPRLLCRRSIERAQAESSVEVAPFKSLKELPLAAEGMGVRVTGRLGMELDVVPVALHQRFEALFPESDWVDVTPMVRETRAVKSGYEIDRIRAAGVQVGKVVEHAREILADGMREVDFASRLEQRARELGHQGILRMRGFNQELFYGHIISGEHAALMSHLDAPSGGMGVNPSIGQGAGFRVIRRGDPVSVDFVGCVDGYLIDQTRLMVVGRLAPELEEGFAAARSIQDRVAAAARPGAAWGSLYDEALRAAVDAGVSDRFMGPAGEQVRFVGHGVGLEVDEFPFLASRLDRPLLAGMVFALEPKVFFPGKGMAGIEDTFLVTPGGVERLTVTEREIIRV